VPLTIDCFNNNNNGHYITNPVHEETPSKKNEQSPKTCKLNGGDSEEILKLNNED
jgi:hypothetical protein